MNTTESGSIAVGAPMSLARLQQELEHYCTPDGSLYKLAATPEGAALIREYMRFVGGYAIDAGSSDTTVQNMLMMSAGIEDERMGYMCYGALFAPRFSMAGRVPSQKEKP